MVKTYNSSLLYIFFPLFYEGQNKIVHITVNNTNKKPKVLSRKKEKELRSFFIFSIYQLKYLLTQVCLLCIPSQQNRSSYDSISFLTVQQETRTQMSVVCLFIYPANLICNEILIYRPTSKDKLWVLIIFTFQMSPWSTDYQSLQDD